jgi:hypothetical protein
MRSISALAAGRVFLLAIINGTASLCRTAAATLSPVNPRQDLAGHPPGCDTVAAGKFTSTGVNQAYSGRVEGDDRGRNR